MIGIVSSIILFLLIDRVLNIITHDVFQRRSLNVNNGRYNKKKKIFFFDLLKMTCTNGNQIRKYLISK